MDEATNWGKGDALASEDSGSRLTSLGLWTRRANWESDALASEDSGSRLTRLGLWARRSNWEGDALASEDSGSRLTRTGSAEPPVFLLKLPINLG